jgi:tetratricopeptide (TPR) repeat protein
MPRSSHVRELSGRQAAWPGISWTSRRLACCSRRVSRSSMRWTSAVTTLGSLGQAAAAEGDYVRARALSEKAVAQARTMGDKLLLASQLRDFATVAGVLFDLTTARAVDEEALALWAELGDRRGVARALMGLGFSDVYGGDPRRARDHFLESLTLGRALGDTWQICGALLGLGHIDRIRGDFTSSHARYAQSLRLSQESNANWTQHLFEALAALAAAEGRAARAVQLLGAAEALREAQRFPLLPYLRPEHEHAVATARAGMDPDAFRAAWAVGRSMALDRAVALALTREE